MTSEALMQIALEQAEEGARAGEPPFGAVIISPAGAVLARSSDLVASLRDWTRHAEIEAVRNACQRLGADLAGHTLVTTVEPCPMCFTAAWLAGISCIVYGATMAEVSTATGGQQRELSIPATTINKLSPEPILLKGGIRSEECLALFHHWGVGTSASQP